MNFYSPLAFSFMAAIPVVIVFYLLKRKRTVRLVASTLLWQKFLAETQASAPFQKLRHNWLMLLQILMLLFVVFALARPYFAASIKGGKLRVIVLDGSASMQAVDEKPTRFDRARSEALKFVDGMADTDQIAVLQAGAVTEVKQSQTSSKAAIRRVLAACEPSDSPTHLREALKLAITLGRDKSGAEIHLFSDGASSDLADFDKPPLPIFYHKVGTRSENAGIVSLDVRSNPENPSQRAVFVSIANFSKTARQTRLEIRFAGKLLDSRLLTIPSGGTSPQVLATGIEGDGVFSARLMEEDDLAADNEAFAFSAVPKPVRVVLVSQGNRFLEKALRAAGNVELTVVADSKEARPTADLVVLDSVAPSVWPERNILSFASAAPSWLKVMGHTENPAIADWKTGHPLLRFTTFDNVQIADAVNTVAPPWAQAVVESAKAPIILAGELGRQRIVWVAFNLFDSTWPLRVSFPIFIANTVDWLNPAGSGSGQFTVKAGTPFRFVFPEAATNASVTLPNGAVRNLAVDRGAKEIVFGDTSRRGVYKMIAGTNQVTFCVNLLDAAESNIAPKDELSLGKRDRIVAAAGQQANLELWRWIALAGMAVLMAEWWYYHRRTV